MDTVLIDSMETILHILKKCKMSKQQRIDYWERLEDLAKQGQELEMEVY